MRKEYMTRYQGIESDQRDLTQSLSSMLNCRRYLVSQGFQEVLDTSNANVNSIGNGYEKILFPDGSEIPNCDFMSLDSNNRDSLIEMMISKRAIYVPVYNTPCVVRTTFGDNTHAYRFLLSIMDTTKEKAGFFEMFFELFKSKPKQFANMFYMGLIKHIITDQDIEEFAKYQHGLEDAMKQDTLLTYAPQVPQRNSAQAKEVKMPQVETHFINPWEIKIPKIGKND